MSDLSYGKEPWHLGRFIDAKYAVMPETGAWQVVDEDGNRIGYFLTENQARKAAAAPTMYATLTRLVAKIEDHHITEALEDFVGVWDIIEEAKVALASADDEVQPDRT